MLMACKYKVDHIIENENNEDIYQYTREFVEDLFFSGNSTIFFYGGSKMGKSMSLLGEGENLGVFQRSILQMLNLIKTEKSNKKKYRINLSVYTIHKKVIHDVLNIKEENKITFRCDHGCNLNRTYLIGNKKVEITKSEDIFLIVNRINEYKNKHKENWEHLIIDINLEKWYCILNDKKENMKKSLKESIDSFKKRSKESINCLLLLLLYR